MRLAVAFLCTALASSAGARTPSERNPFSPSAIASSPSGVASPPTRSPASTPRLAGAAAQLPPSIPAPPPGLRLPPVVPLTVLPPLVAKSAGADKPRTASWDGAADAAPVAAGGSAPAGTSEAAHEDQPGVFLSRGAIERGRAACQISLRSPEQLHLGADGGQLRISFNNPTGQRCFAGMQSDKVWATLRGAGSSQAEVAVQPNPTGRARSTRLVIATASSHWTLILTQAAGTGADELDELELDVPPR